MHDIIIFSLADCFRINIYFILYIHIHLTLSGRPLHNVRVLNLIFVFIPINNFNYNYRNTSNFPFFLLKLHTMSYQISIVYYSLKIIMLPSSIY